MKVSEQCLVADAIRKMRGEESYYKTMVWRVETYQSGTMIVTRNEHKLPHFYVYGPKCSNEDEYERTRYQYCQDLAEHMNGGKVPVWLAGMVRVSETKCVHPNGASITITGLMIDADPPNLHWVHDDSFEAQAARARLMDQMFGMHWRK